MLWEWLKGKVLESEPVAWFAVLILVGVAVQKIWLGEAITQDWIEWALGILGLATGASVVRSQVTSKSTLNKGNIEDHG